MPLLGARATASRGYFGGGTTPDAPTSLVATRGNTQLSVAFSAPAFNGGLEITTYEYALSTNSYATWTTRATGTTASPLVITGLSNGTSYQVKLRAVNTLGAGAVSAASAAVTPATVPGTPTSPSISSGNGSISVSWVAPSDGGNPPLTYTVETQKNSEAYVNRGLQTSPYPLSGTGINNGATYRAKITANNTVGSSATAAVTGDTVPSAVPDAPTFLSASSGDGTYNIAWTAPANNGAAITSYTVQLTTANQAVWDADKIVTGVTAENYTFSGLSNGYSYRAKVLAVNTRGSGPYMDPLPSGQETPSSTPGVPTITAADWGDKSYKLTWTAPENTGGTGVAVTYTVQLTTAGEIVWDSGKIVSDITGLSHTFTGLTNGSIYRARVKADNVRGSSAYVDGWPYTTRTPTFAAPAVSVTNSADVYNPGVRTINFTITPTAAVDYDRTELWLAFDGDQNFGDTSWRKVNRDSASGTGQFSVSYTTAWLSVGFDYGISYSGADGNLMRYKVVTYNTSGYGVANEATYRVDGQKYGAYTYAIPGGYTYADSTATTGVVACSKAGEVAFSRSVTVAAGTNRQIKEVQFDCSNPSATKDAYSSIRWFTLTWSGTNNGNGSWSNQNFNTPSGTNPARKDITVNSGYGRTSWGAFILTASTTASFIGTSTTNVIVNVIYTDRTAYAASTGTGYRYY